MTGMQEAHVVLLSRLHWFLCAGLIVAESGTAVKQASDLHCSSGALGGREADARPSGQAAPCLPWPGYIDNPPSDLIRCSPSAALVQRRCARTRGPRVA